MHNSVNAEN